jgi:hypothetical protein
MGIFLIMDTVPLSWFNFQEKFKGDTLLQLRVLDLFSQTHIKTLVGCIREKCPNDVRYKQMFFFLSKNKIQAKAKEHETWK